MITQSVFRFGLLTGVPPFAGESMLLGLVESLLSFLANSEGLGLLAVDVLLLLMLFAEEVGDAKELLLLALLVFSGFAPVGDVLAEEADEVVVDGAAATLFGFRFGAEEGGGVVTLLAAAD